MDVLVIGAHPDDAEIGLGGTIARLAQAGLKVALVDLTDGEPTPHGDRVTRRQEAQAAADLLGVERRITLSLPNRYLQDTVEARKELARVLRQLRPRLVFSPLPQDQHPDHLAAALIAQNARFYAKFTKTDLPGEPFYPPLLLQYAGSHLRRVFKPQAIVDISSTFRLKLQAVLTYRSQFGWREEAMRDWLITSAKFYGGKIGVEYGEPIFTPEELPVWDPAELVPR